MIVLGLSVFCDASAAIVSDGEIVCAVEEERINRIKHFEGMPWLAVEECLRLTGMTLNEIDAIAVGWHPWQGWGRRISVAIRDSVRRPAAMHTKLDRGGNYLQGIKDILRLRRSVQARFGGNVPDIHYVPHHLAHAASSFLASPHDNAHVVVADGVGEAATFTIYDGEGNSLKQKHATLYPHSLGHLYASVTGFLGFRPASDEGKVMALASYGEDRYHELFSDLCSTVNGGGTFRLNTDLLDYHEARQGQFSNEWIRRTRLQPRSKDDPLSEAHQDLACSLQSCIERTVFSMLAPELAGNGSKALCAAGGLFLNSVLNGRLVRELAADVFIQPAAGDNGVSIGAGLYVAAKLDNNFRRKPMRHAFLGTAYDDSEVQGALNEAQCAYTRPENIARAVADEIVAGSIVARFVGQMEFGPRALGNRSILASPTIAGMKDTLNRKVKHRETFRPFAAAVLLEDVAEYFVGGKESSYMLKVFYFKPQYRDMFPSICHVDGSCRLQTVTEEDNPHLHAVLTEMKKQTGHGMVLNTSLNVAGEPIVRTPQEAIKLIRTTEVDTLAVGSFLLKK